ncbi:hypothetical protein DPMN_132929 [Dreissena polymorpha]|uniref:Uncharacterized protein n=1 Tax=Dreissena polymorpha TaxID=45954 RepID=A0A9D4FTB7_DREPO|nr:hypothetical protein DPMN_132929 [Dreissena polymorpha]
MLQIQDTQTRIEWAEGRLVEDHMVEARDILSIIDRGTGLSRKDRGIGKTWVKIKILTLGKLINWEKKIIWWILGLGSFLQLQ